MAIMLHRILLSAVDGTTTFKLCDWNLLLVPINHIVWQWNGHFNWTSVRRARKFYAS